MENYSSCNANRENYTDNYGSSCNVSQENLTEPYSTCGSKSRSESYWVGAPSRKNFTGCSGMGWYQGRSQCQNHNCNHCLLKYNNITKLNYMRKQYYQMPRT